MADSTTYIVLRARDTKPDDSSGDWMEYAQRDAPSAQAAVRAALNSYPMDGTFVAIPLRSWKPVQVEAVQTMILKIS